MHGVDTRCSDHDVCRAHIEARLDAAAASNAGAQAHLAALIIEPLLQGAGGMLMVDPAFQRALVQVRAVL